jgi:hypothetical protein
LQGRAALQQKRVAQAQKFFEQAASMALRNTDADQSLEFAAWSARAEAAAGDGAKALKMLQNSFSEFGSKAGASTQFEGRLALAELALKFGDASQGRALLEAIEKDASGKNFSVFARKAAALRNPS